MKFFIDTANVDEIRKAVELGVVDGVTTNPSLIAREGRDFIEVVKEITADTDEENSIRNAEYRAKRQKAAA